MNYILNNRKCRKQERERKGLAEEFLQSLDRLIDMISDFPEGFPIVHQDIRRALLKRFPYSVLFRIKENHLIIAGCFHSRRNPKSGQSRR